MFENLVNPKLEQDWGKNGFLTQFFIGDFFNMGSSIALK
jgi:hypothetical protein